jgi:Cdc48 subfamily AAA family protein
MLRVNVPLDPIRTGREAEALVDMILQDAAANHDPVQMARRIGTALEVSLVRLIVGRDESIAQIVNIYQVYLAGMTAPGRPIRNFLFLGPTGSGKTRIVEATAKSMLAAIKIDCAEFQHSHEIAKLIGSSPGYLGHRETHPLLSQEVLSRRHTEACKLSFVLSDEIEKASDTLWNLFLGILDKGTLALGDNRKVDFSRALIFMTSNLGAIEMSACTNPRLGFHTVDAARQAQSGQVDEKVNGKMPVRAPKPPRGSLRRNSSTGWTRSSISSSTWLSRESSTCRPSLQRPPMKARASCCKEREPTSNSGDARHLKRVIERLLSPCPI